MSEATKSGRNLISATRKYAKEDKAKSWWYTLSTFGLWIFFSGLAIILPTWPAQTAAAVIAGMISCVPLSSTTTMFTERFWPAVSLRKCSLIYTVSIK